MMVRSTVSLAGLAAGRVVDVDASNETIKSLMRAGFLVPLLAPRRRRAESAS